MYASEKTDSEPMMVSTTLKNIVGEIIGSVMLQNLRQAPAPSISAASYISWGTLWRAARKMIILLPPMVPQSATIVTDGIAQVPDWSQAGPSIPTMLSR